MSETKGRFIEEAEQGWFWLVEPNGMKFWFSDRENAVSLKVYLDTKDENTAKATSLVGELMMALAAVMPMAETYCKSVENYVDPMVRYRHRLVLDMAATALGLFRFAANKPPPPKPPPSEPGSWERAGGVLKEHKDGEARRVSDGQGEGHDAAGDRDGGAAEGTGTI